MHAARCYLAAASVIQRLDREPPDGSSSRGSDSYSLQAQGQAEADRVARLLAGSERDLAGARRRQCLVAGGL